VTTLVTGAGGLLGSHIVDLLVAAGSRPRALFAPGEPAPPSTTVDARVGDVRDRSVARAALDGVDRVVHCAARTGPWGPPAEYESTNVRALETLVGLARQEGVKRVVHVSSITVHGNDVRGTADETAPLRAEPNPYSRSKVAGERVLRRLIDDGAPLTVVRPGWIYGPRDNASFARLARTIGAGRMLMIGSGDNHVPLVYVDDVARGALQAADAEGAVGRAYLLVNDEPVTQREYLVAIAHELGAPAPRWRLPYRAGLALGGAAELTYRAARRQEAPPLTRFGIQLLGGENRFRIDRARAELGFAPEVMLAEGVKRSVEWYRQSRGGA
jgi:2-alkyl-3-oxoalkanoate reductase